MAATTTVLSILLRVLGLIQLVVGILFWTGNALGLIPVHMTLGSLLVLCLWGLAIVGLFARVHWGLILLAFVWGAFVSVFGMMQGALLPGSFHWIIQVLHLLVGFAALGLGEGVVARIKTNRLTPMQA